MAKRGGGSGRKYVRDSIGRFASKGYSGQTSGRGARLKAKGKKRDGGGAIVKPTRIGEMKNTISKSKSKRKVNASSRATDRQIARDVAARSKPTAAAKARKARTDGDAFAARAKKARGTETRRYLNEGSRRDSLSSEQRVKTSSKVREAASQKRAAKSRSTASRAKAFYQNFGSPSTFSRRDRKNTRDSDRFGSKKRGAKKKSVTANSARATGKPAAAKPAAAKRRGAVGKISEAKAGRIVARMDAQRGRKALPGRRNANFVRTYERSRQFILKPSTAALKKGKPISVNESVQKAVSNAAKRRKAKPAAAKPAAAKTKLKRSGEKTGVGRLTTNKQQGRKGIVSMSSQAKAARKGAVAERKSAKMSRIAERQSEIVARRQGRRASNYNPDGTFNQSTANANQRRLGRSKQLQEKLSYAGGGKNIASKALAKRRSSKRRRS